jgi:ribonuclease HII
MKRGKSSSSKVKPRAQKQLGPVDWLSYQPVPVVGCDEVGRGCLAGPVVAAAVILTKPVQGLFFDSKTLSEPRREELFQLIQAEHQWAVGFASVEEIDRLNILNASLLAMQRAVKGLRVKSGHVLVDGKFPIPRLGSGFLQTTLIQGDSRAEPVSAASIAAKVTRDRFMKELAEKFPHYGFEQNKGYGTAAHLRVLAKMGPTPHHRLSFAGVVDE